jgi:glycosyltransferase involved in cell wall biosynthesis
MKILIVSPYLPHPLSGHGTGVFMYGLLQHLSPHHDVTLVSFCDERELGLAPDVRKLPLTLVAVPRGKGAQKNFLGNVYLFSMRSLQLLRSIVFWQPYYVSKWRHSRMVRIIRRLTSSEKYDIVQFEFPSMGQYGRFVRHGKTVLHEHDVAFRPAYRRFRNSKSIPKKFVMYVEWCRWALYEPRIVRQFDHVLSVTEQDKLLLERLSKGSHISYFHRGIDVAATIPPYETRESQSILFLGTFAHSPNVDAAIWLCEEIFPLVVKRFPSARLYVAGPNPPSRLVDAAEGHEGINILGFVDDAVAYYRRCSVFVAPLRYGGGVKLKILHAMGQGIPVVSTKIGIEGIEGMDTEIVAVGDSPQKLAEHISGLFGDPQRAAEMGRRGWETVRRHYSWESVVSRLEQIYSNVMHS